MGGKDGFWFENKCKLLISIKIYQKLLLKNVLETSLLQKMNSNDNKNRNCFITTKK
jgi:hypothetical protein